ncbi:mechanosensitive ion channel family protein [Chloroflexota bacterium]
MEFMLDWLYVTGWKIIVIVGITLGTLMMIRRFAPMMIKRTVTAQMKGKRKVEKEKRQETLVRIITTLSGTILGTIGIFLVLTELGINVTAAVAGMGIIGVALGFGAQFLVRDYIGGFFIFLENQFNVGDVIKAVDITGIVEEISIRRTILRDLDGARHTISNGQIRVLTNYTQRWSRANLDISVAYKEDLDRVMAIMRRTWEEMAEDPDWRPCIVSKTPTIMRVNEFGDSGIKIKIVGETEPIKQWDVMGEYRRRIKRVFDEEGVEIPWPHIKLYYGEPEPPRKER